MAVRYELAVGLNKGFKTTKIRRVTYKGNKKIKGLKGTNVKNVSEIFILLLYHRRKFMFCESITSTQLK